MDAGSLEISPGAVSVLDINCQFYFLRLYLKAEWTKGPVLLVFFGRESSATESKKPDTRSATTISSTYSGANRMRTPTIPMPTPST